LATILPVVVADFPFEFFLFLLFFQQTTTTSALASPFLDSYNHTTTFNITSKHSTYSSDKLHLHTMAKIQLGTPQEKELTVRNLIDVWSKTLACSHMGEK
jgi:hypothetical protein